MTQQERLSDRWHTLDYPVLLELARALEAGEYPDRDAVTQKLGLERAQVDRAIAGLCRGDYLDLYAGGPEGRTIRGALTGQSLALTERGRRAVGLWPSGEDVDALVDALRQAEQSTSDPAEQGRIRQAAGALMSVSREVMVDVIASVVAKQTGAG